MYKKDIFDSVLSTFENEDVREFTEKCIDAIPEYFYSVPASSTGKYHPEYALGDGGLVRHTLALVRIMNHLFSIDCVKNQFSSRERDLMRLSGLMHDTRKSGSQDEFEKNKYTKFNHPILAADEVVRIWKLDDKPIITRDDLKIVYLSIRSHMGQWNTDKRNPDVELPVPKTKYEILVHACDYLASRKDINIIFDDEVSQKLEPAILPDVNTWIVPFGKYKGKTLVEIQKEDPDYIKWAKDKSTSEPFSSLAKTL